jgi:predicted dehydrogenase
MIRRDPAGDERASPGTALRIVVAGVGFWGRSWIEVVSASPDWELVGLVDADESALARAAGASGLSRDSCFPSVRDAVDVVLPDAALVVVPPAVHAPVALDALDSGLHCLNEKPFAETLEQARAVVERGDAAERIVMVNQQYRHRPGARAVRQLVGDGAIGVIGNASITFAERLPVTGFQHQMEEPLLRDMAIHHFDLIRAVLALEPARVFATSHNPPWSEFAGNAAATVVFEAGDGVTITYAGTWAPRGVTTGWNGVWEIVGERGVIHWDGDIVRVRGLEVPVTAKVLRRATGVDWRGSRVRPPALERPDRAGSLVAFADAIRGNREPETSGRDNLRSLALTLAAVESARRRTAVDVDELLDSQ